MSFGRWLCLWILVVSHFHPTWGFNLRVTRSTSGSACDLSVTKALHMYPEISSDVGICDNPATKQDEDCVRDSYLLQQNALNHTLWASIMMDASATAALGVLHGTRFSLGNFDGCLAAGKFAPVGSRYCLAHFTTGFHPGDLRSGGVDGTLGSPPWSEWEDLSPWEDTRNVLQGLGRFGFESSLQEFWVALCVPRSCGALQVQRALLRNMGTRNPGVVRVRVEKESCSSDQTHVPVGPFIFGFLCTILLMLAAAATCLDVMGIPPTSRKTSWVMSWSVPRRWKGLFAPEQPLKGVALQPVAGIRVGSLLLLMVAHHAMHLARTPLTNNFVTRNTYLDPTAAVMTQGYLYVYTMFFLSGLFVALGARKTFFQSLVLRYLRLTPTYLAVVAFYALVLPTIGDGPRWNEMISQEADACRGWWWTNLLYFNNYARPDATHGCILQSWYLAVDMQLFIFATFLLFLEISWKKPAKVLWAIAISIALLAPFITTIEGLREPVWRFLPSVLEDIWGWPFLDRYVSAEQWALPYFVGIFTGRFLEKSVKSGFVLKLDKMVIVLVGTATLLPLLLMTGTLWNYSDMNQHSVFAGLYTSGISAAWSASLSLCCVALALGPRTVVQKFLECPLFSFLSKLCYGIYLVHFGAQIAHVAWMRTPRHVTRMNILTTSFLELVCILPICMALYLLIEAPVREISKDLFKTRSVTEDVELPVQQPSMAIDVAEPDKETPAAPIETRNTPEKEPTSYDHVGADVAD